METHQATAAHVLGAGRRDGRTRPGRNPNAWVIVPRMDASQMGRKGGQSRSAAKRAAARRNGALGGRPRKADEFARTIREVCLRLAPDLPAIDPGDLRMIVRSLLL